MRKLTWLPLLVIVVVIILAFVASRFFYYTSGVSAYTPPERKLTEANIESVPKSARLAAPENPAVSRGVVVVDYNHNNALYIEELNVLLSKIVSRGFSYEILAAANTDNQSEQSSSSTSTSADQPTLADKLRYATALILPLPREEYTPAEIAEIRSFVEKGGRVLIIGDPTRTQAVEALNSIAGEFGIIYANDYLYSLEHNDTNYRNVIYTQFNPSPITKGLTESSKVIFYAGGSVSAPGHEIILGDDTTHSSLSEGGRVNAAAVLTTDDRVLALTDLTFLTEPYSNADNNGILINNIADFLASEKRGYNLADFPYFFNPTIDIVFDNSLVFNSQFDNSVRLKDALEQTDRVVNFADTIGDKNDAIFVGRFDEADVVSKYLEAGGITIAGPEETPQATTTPTPKPDNNLVSEVTPGVEDRFIEGRIQIKGVGDLERGGSTLFYLYRNQGRNVLIILSDNPKTNTDGFNILLKNQLDKCLLSSTIAVCQTEEPGQQLPPSLRSTRINKVLVVSDDTGRVRNDELTGAVDFYNVLTSTYQVDILTISHDGAPDINQLLEYDAVIWATGDYWDDSINAENAALLTKYVEVGGNLILSGASIAFDWDHTDFLSSVVHARYHGFAPQADMEPALTDHPIADGFVEGEIINFVETPSGEPLPIDVVDATPDARVIFKRGPASEDSGAASVIAYEDNRVKIAYYAFPFYLLPTDAQDRLLNNTVNWFTKKPLESPLGEPSASPAPTTEPSPTEEPTPSNEGGNGG